jgi:outer membrane protein insertion porin family
LKKAIVLSLVITFSSASTLVNSIKFENLSRISSKIALENVALSKGDTYNTKQITKAIKSFYKFGYFDDISVEQTNGNIIFTFTEKPSIVNIEILGYKSRDDEKSLLYDKMGIKKGSMYTKQRVAKAKTALLNMLKIEGYYNSVIELSTSNFNAILFLLIFSVDTSITLL